MIRFVVMFFLVFLLVSCSEKSYEYKTFDYKSMQIVKLDTVLDASAWVDPIVVNSDTIMVNVFLQGAKTKRVFINKQEYWYSELNYRHNPVIGTGHELYEVFQKYYIYPTYIIKEIKSSNDYQAVVYLDLLKNDLYYFHDSSKEFFVFEKALLGDYEKYLFYMKESELYKKQISFDKGVNVGESAEMVYGYYGDDVFFILDLEEYKIGEGSFLGYMEVFGNE